MPKINDTTPAQLKPYLFHGVDLNWSASNNNAMGDCPFCGKERKFAVRIDTGQWRCLVCGAGSEKGGGNIYTFLKLVMENASFDGAELASHRGLLDKDTLAIWRAGRNSFTEEWILPGYSAAGKLTQLYRYIDGGGDRYRLYATPGLNHQLYGTHIFDPRKPTIYLCEGPWDGMALWEVLKHAKEGNAGITFTAKESTSMGAKANVLAVPGCASFSEEWLPLFAGKKVVLMYDNDHPRKHPKTGASLAPAALEGMKRAVALLAGATEPPAELHYLAWGPDGYDPLLPSGSDVRDWLKEGITAQQRVSCLADLFSRIHPVPPEWLPGGSITGGVVTKLEIECLPCDSWKTLTTAWKKAMRWTPGLNRGLACMLASVLSTMCIGDQLWLKIIGPPASGKSTLCEALSVNRKYILPKSTIRGFHSGYMTDREGKEDNSLLYLARDKTLVIKDGDTLLQAPNLGQILAEARDVYDRTSRTHYRNKMSKDYGGVNMTVLLCGTKSLRSLDASELGERFLDVVIVDRIDDELENAVALQVAHRADRDLDQLADGKNVTVENAEMTLAKQLTGGYVDYLRLNTAALMARTRSTGRSLRKCARLAKFVSFMRARPSGMQEEEASRELCFRLTSQLVRLAKCLSAVLNRPQVDDVVLEMVSQVALDTARGRTMTIAHWLYRTGEEGTTINHLASWMNETPNKLKDLLHFMREIGVLQLLVSETVSGYSRKPKWVLTPVMRSLWEEIVGKEDPPGDYDGDEDENSAGSSE